MKLAKMEVTFAVLPTRRLGSHAGVVAGLRPCGQGTKGVTLWRIAASPSASHFAALRLALSRKAAAVRD